MDAWELVKTYTNGLSYHAGMLYNNRAMSTGGVSGGVAVPWVLHSLEGTYVGAIDRTPYDFPARARHAACSYNERMFVSGGVLDSDIYGDILASQDGVQWESMGSLEHPVYDHRMVAFGNPMVELVILGGADASDFYHYIYRTVDGRKLTKVEEQGSLWSPRSGFGALVYKNKLWVFGGRGPSDTYYNDVWWTDDLIHWHRALEHAPWSVRSDFGYCEWDERMWLIGGKIYDGGRQGYVWYSDVWFSRDGSTWEQAFDFPVEVGFTYAQPINNKIHVFGGVNNEYNIYKMNLG